MKCWIFLACGVFAGAAHAQSGIGRVTTQLAPAPTIPAAAAPAPAAASTPPNPANTPLQAPGPVGTPGTMPMPLPGGPLPAPLNLKQEALDKIAPMPAKDILELRGDLRQRSEAMQQSLDPIAKPIRSFRTLDLGPSAPPEVIRTAFSQGSVISFVDAGGRPWPIVLADNFNPAGYDVAVFGTNGVSIGPKRQSAATGNLAVLLEGMNSPITFSVVTGQREIDYSIELQLPRFLPGQAPPVGATEQIRSLGAADLMNFLLNTPPQGAKLLQSDNATVAAWQVSPDRMIVRTEALIASPAWQRRQSSNSGMNVYDLPITPRLVVASQGHMVNVRLSGFAATKEQR